MAITGPMTKSVVQPSSGGISGPMQGNVQYAPKQTSSVKAAATTALPKQLKAPTGGFKVGDNIFKTNIPLIDNAEKFVMNLSNGVKALLTAPSIKSPVPEKSLVKATPQKSIPVVTDLKTGQKQLTVAQMSQIQPIGGVQKTPLEKLLPQTVQAVKGINADPMNKKADPHKAISEGIKSMQESFNQEKKRIQALFAPNQSASQRTGKGLEAVAGGGNLILSPITALFTGAEQVPVLGTAAKFITLPFVAVGEGATQLSNKAVDALPIPNQAKKDIKQGVGEIASLAAQIALGKATEIGATKKAGLIDKFGKEDAATIVTEAKKLAQEKTGKNTLIPTDILKDGEHTPQAVIDALVNNKLTDTADGQKLMKTALEAKNSDQNIRIESPNPEIDAFNKNLEDYRSYGGYSAGTHTENAALRDIGTAVDTPDIKAHTQEKVNQAIDSGELKLNDDGTVTLYRGGEPSTKNGLMSASYDKSVAQEFADNAKTPLREIKVKPEDIKAFIGKAEKEVLLENPRVVPQEVGVPRTQLPTGQGKEKVSRLEARMKGVIGKATDEQIKDLGLSTYNQMNRKETVGMAAEYVVNNPEDALRVLKGEISPPKDIPPESIYVALTQQAKDDITLATKLQTFQSTALGQRLSLLAEIDKDNPVKIMSDIYKFRAEEIAKRTGKKIEKLVSDTAGEIKKRVKVPDKHDWNSFIDSIQC